MIVVLERGTTPEQAQTVLAELEALGLEARVVHGAEKPLLHVFRGPTRLTRKVLGLQRVEGLVPTSGPRVRREGRRFYPFHFVNWSAATLLTMGVLVAMAGFFPPGLGGAMDVQNPPGEHGRPWYLLVLDGLGGSLPGGSPLVGWLVALGLGLVMFFLPLIDRSTGTRVRERWLPLALVGLALLGILYLILPKAS